MRTVRTFVIAVGVVLVLGVLLLAAFPNGLPPDPFASSPGTTLGSDNTRPVLIYSLGPDRQESRIKGVRIDGPFRIPYDPTNGLNGRGDLVLELPPKRP